LIDWLKGSPGIIEIHEAKIDIYGRARREGYGVLGLHVIDGRKITKHISQRLQRKTEIDG
jgi:hypothetical protein